MLSRDLSALIFKALHNPLRAKDAVAYSATCRNLWQWLLEARDALREQKQKARGLAMRLRLLKAVPDFYWGVSGLRRTHTLLWDMGGQPHWNATQDVRQLATLSAHMTHLRHLTLHAFEINWQGMPNPI